PPPPPPQPPTPQPPPPPPPPAAPKPAAAGGAAAGAAGDASSIRVSVGKVDQLINLVGELVINQAMLAETASKVDPVLYEQLTNGIAQLERNTRNLQESVMSMRMMPVSSVFSRFPRVVRDISQRLGKDIELRFVGENTEIDRGVIEKIADPLTHLVRNSLDHGIETPEVRSAAGKPTRGTLTLRASHQGANIVIEVIDDGGGLRRDKILAKARERGFTVSDSMPDAEVWQLIFEPGFSTADQVTDVSGRGVGMDVVRRNIAELGGRIDIESRAGRGTHITIRLPLTLAILDGLSVALGDETYIIPLAYIVESLQPQSPEISTVGGDNHVVQVRQEYLPVLSLAQVLGGVPRAARYEEGIFVILESEATKIALFVDELVGENQVVIKSLESNYAKVSGISGATILGDGRVALILDVAALVRRCSHAQQRNAA
ncbi:MAG: chemotaxis protein CheA, partial [Rhodocyclaceae bacterium]|nr:chemotaxis protein CheA [Rhodocyclaceae bacterium]